MPEVTSELMFELLEPVRHDIGELRQDVSETKRELNVMRATWWQRKVTSITSMAFSPARTIDLNA
ncbi:hypothetical protein [Mesorhizobium sp. LNHC229A00]|uniref:hypothetical protein n=1 Tax=Mesorhizobium sp. LNHC229A00 TaxID=1287240 RepID=UPI0026880B11